MRHDELTQRIRAEYLEDPGLRITGDQARRLFGIEREPCKAALKTLVDEQFLSVQANGSYGQSSDRPVQMRAANRTRPR